MPPEAICSAALIIQYGRVLMVQEGQHEWLFPEAHAEAGENLYEALERAAMQRLSLDVVAQEIFTSQVDNGTRYDGIFALPMDNEEIALHGYSHFDWLDIATLPQQPIASRHRAIAAQLVKDYS